MKAEEFVKTFTKEEILDTLFHESCVCRETVMNLCNKLYEKRSAPLLDELERVTSRAKYEGLEQYARYEKKIMWICGKLDKLKEELDSLEW